MDPEKISLAALARTEHGWVYRGQIFSTNKRVTVQVHIKSIDDAIRTVVADGYLIAGGLPIYQITNFT